MPVIKVGPKGGEGEALPTPVTPVTPGLSGDLARVVTNQTLAEHVGKFVAGEVQTKFASENLADQMARARVHVSASWG